jgi:hypothetical protein
VTLTWSSNHAADVILRDDRGHTFVDTTRLLSNEKSRFFRGSQLVTPTVDTAYTLTVIRGHREEVCTARVSLADQITVIETRDQQPLVVGIPLSQVPHTGFEAGPVLTMVFYLLLLLWSLYIAYALVIRRSPVAGYELGGENTAPASVALTGGAGVRSDALIPKLAVKEASPHVAPPNNLPVGAAVSAINHGEQSNEASIVSPLSAEETFALSLEKRAHECRVLISNDAIRHFIATTRSVGDRLTALDIVIKAARERYPSEDGWVVINEARMRETCLVCSVNANDRSESTAPAVVPATAGSLAEAIASGSVVNAYALIGHRPMFALADAAADLDALFRTRRGETAPMISELLKREAAALSDEQIKAMIDALTGALDGTYGDEASAVKMAIMKAIKARG